MSRPAARLFARKPVEMLCAGVESDSEPKLQRTLGFFSLTCFGVGSTIGAGIFVLTGTVAAQHAGPAVVLSFLLAGSACALCGLCYAEFAGLVPVAGSAYTYAYATLGEIVAWIVGWCLVLEYLFAAALIAIGWSGYAVALLREVGIALPPALTDAPFAAGVSGLGPSGALCNVPAVLVVIACAVLLLVGTRAAARVNNLIVAAKVALILVVGIAGMFYVKTSHWSPLVPPNSGHFGDFGLSGIATGAAVVFYAYIGFDAVSTMSQEARRATRTVPLALMASLLVCTTLYVLVAVMVTGLVDYRSLAGVADPVYVALEAGGAGLAWTRPLVGVVVVVGLISALLVTMLGQVRIFYAMACDGLLPKMFHALHPKSSVPHWGTVVTALACAVIAGFCPLTVLADLISIGTLLAFLIVCVGVMVLRLRRPDLPRPFKVPAYPWIPLGGIATCLGLMLSLPTAAWVRLAIWIVLGLLVYGGYGVRRSLVQQSVRSSTAADTPGRPA